MKRALQVAGAIFIIFTIGGFVHQLRKGTGGPRPTDAALKQVIVDATNGLPGLLVGQAAVVDRGLAVYVSQSFKSSDDHLEARIEEKLIRAGWRKGGMRGARATFCRRPLMLDFVKETESGDAGSYLLRSYWGDFPIYCPGM